MVDCAAQDSGMAVSSCGVAMMLVDSSQIPYRMPGDFFLFHIELQVNAGEQGRNSGLS